MSASQPGYDALARTYADLIDGAFQSPLEQAAADAFADHVRAAGLGSQIVDVGSGTGHVAVHLVNAGFSVIPVEPSRGMRDQSRLAHPDVVTIDDDATLRTVDLARTAGVIARFSLIHVEPDAVRDVLHDWASRLRAGSVVLIAGQSADEHGVHEFDHAVARAWRWHPDAMADALTDAGFGEMWRTVSRQAEGFHRFPELHICATRR